MSRRDIHERAGRLSALACAAVCVCMIVVAPPAAQAHVQVRPATTAPNDAVLFDVLVPNERSQRTTEVELQVPPGVIPFSYEETPGWTRTLTKGEDGSTRTIIWRGRLRPDGFARFSLLASTPPGEGPIAWKSIQTYGDGRKTRWIGPAGSESPAAVTTVSKRFPKQNAGGEGSGTAPVATNDGSSPEAAGASGDSSDDTARWLAAAGLAAGLVALAVVLLRGRGEST